MRPIPTDMGAGLRRRGWAAMLAVWALSAALMPASAQVTVNCRLANERVLLFAPAPVRISLLNNSGRMLLLDGGREGAELRLEVEGRGGRIIHRRQGGLLVPSQYLMPGENRVLELDVMSLFDIQETGRYAVRAVVDWGLTVYASADTSLEVVRGFELQRLRAGVQGDAGAVRVYILEYMQKPSGEDIYLRVEDDRSKAIVGVFPLGAVIRTRPPQMQLDESGNVHVLFQSKNMRVIHCAVTPFGVKLFSSAYPALHGEARLVRDDSGQVSALILQPPELPINPPPPRKRWWQR